MRKHVDPRRYSFYAEIMSSTPIILAQSIGDVASVLFWGLVVIGFVVGGFFGVKALRQWLKSDDSDGKIGFTLADLRDLKRNGKMSDEEFERAKAMILATVQMPPIKSPSPVRPQKNGPRST